MTKYFAFLRGINVGGRVLKMDLLTRYFVALGFKDAKTFIQSGNVVFTSPEKNAKALETKIEKKLLKELGYEVPTFLRTERELEALVELDPFKKMKEGAKVYITFIKEELKVNFPHSSEKDGVRILGARKNDLFSQSLPLQGGKWGFPNVYIEKQFKIAATTRNWNTTTKILGK
ncbi:MAG TPA: DUF1697 domain-containing protein [bacterium]|nr:DUF1697 domain-containing protein [bacterium]